MNKIERRVRWLVSLALMFPLFVWSSHATAQQFLTCTGEGFSVETGTLTGLCAGNWIITPGPYTASVPPGSQEGLSSFFMFSFVDNGTP